MPILYLIRFIVFFSCCFQGESESLNSLKEALSSKEGFRKRYLVSEAVFCICGWNEKANSSRLDQVQKQELRQQLWVCQRVVLTLCTSMGKILGILDFSLPLHFSLIPAELRLILICCLLCGRSYPSWQCARLNTLDVFDLQEKWERIWQAFTCLWCSGN